MKKRKLLIILLAAFLTPLAINAQERANTDMWDYVNSFRASTGRQQNLACDGQYIYTATYSKNPTGNPPVNSMFYQYDFEGNLIDEFDIPNCPHLRDLAYDGQYFYGGAASGDESRLVCVDLTNRTYIGAVTTPLEAIRHCSYDPVNDGFWIGTSVSLMRINRQGQVMETVSGVPPTGLYCNGSGYFTDEDGIPHLLMFCNSGVYPFVYDFNIATHTFNNTAELAFADTPGYIAYGGAGGAFVGQYQGNTYFFGSSPSSPVSFIGIYALEAGDIPGPNPPTPPEGDAFFDFEDAFLQWNPIDADGDGYNWQLERNWGNTQNTYSISSQSRDELLELPLTPDNYLVTPYQIDCQRITFRACAKDVNFPAEHFGIAVSTTGGTDPADFTTIWETDMTAKEQGMWYDYAIDLREYDGHEIWVALRHFGCTDQFKLVVDDITLVRKWDQVSDEVPASFTLSPNPAKDKVQVSCKNTVDSYEVFTLTGTKVLSGQADSATFTIEVGDLPAGVYLIRCSSKDEKRTLRLVKE